MPDLPREIEAEDAAAEPYDTSDPAAVNRARKKDARLHRERLEVVQGIMKTSQGRAWMYAKLAEAHIFEPSFNNDPFRTAYQEGERNQGLRMLGEIMDAAPDQYVVMVKEGKAAERRG